MNDWKNKIFQHDALKPFPIPDSVIDVVITSPPYWGLRDYGIDNQIGLENHPSEYIYHLIAIAKEIKRVLKKSGSFYLNLGDTYYSSPCGNPERISLTLKNSPEYLIGKQKGISKKSYKPDNKCCQSKQLMLIPSRVAIALQDNGWILRNDIIWHKPNPMPSSVKDRLNNTFEHVFHFVKSRKYYYDLDAIREAYKPSSITRHNAGYHPNKADFSAMAGLSKYQGGELHSMGKNPGDIVESWNWRAGMNRDETEIIEVRVNMPSQKDFVDYLKPKVKGFEKKLDDVFTETKWKHWIRYDDSGFAFPSKDNWIKLKQVLELDDTFDLTQTELKYNAVYNSPKGKTPGDFWDICTQPFTSYNPELEHFAVFPEELIIKPLKSSCPKEICKKCGKPRTRIIKPTEEYKKYLGKSWHNHKDDLHVGQRKDDTKGHRTTANYETVGWSDCKCKVGFESGVVLDPFCGRGTVGKVAKDLGLNYILFDIKPEYVELAYLYVHGQKQKLIKHQKKLNHIEDN